MTGRELLTHLASLNGEELDQEVIYKNYEYHCWSVIDSDNIALTPQTNVSAGCEVDNMIFIKTFKSF